VLWGTGLAVCGAGFGGDYGWQLGDYGRVTGFGLGLGLGTWAGVSTGDWATMAGTDVGDYGRLYRAVSIVLHSF